MTCQFQDSHDPHDSENLYDSSHVLKLKDFAVGLGEEDGDVVREDCCKFSLILRLNNVGTT